MHEWLWNDEKFMEVGSLDYRKREKEMKEKYQALSDAWGIDTKPGKATKKSLARKVLGWLRR